MPIITGGAIERSQDSPENIVAPIGYFEYMGYRFNSQLRDNPTTLVYDYGRSKYYDETSSNRISKADADNISKENGLSIDVPEAGMSREHYDFLLDRKKQAREGQLTEFRAQASGLKAGPGALSAFGGGMLDPIGWVVSLGPVGKAGVAAAQAGIAARLARSALSGFVSGAGSTAIMEPAVYGLHKALQDDYSAYDSLQNIAFGGAVGGGLHMVGGLAKDVAPALGKWWNPEQVSKDPPYQERFTNFAKGNDTDGIVSVPIGGRNEPGRWLLVEAGDVTKSAPSVGNEGIVGPVNVDRLLSDDAPIITSDGYVVDGVKRLNAIDGEGQAYREKLSSALEAYGIPRENLNKMKSPVLVKALDRYLYELGSETEIRNYIVSNIDVDSAANVTKVDSSSRFLGNMIADTYTEAVPLNNNKRGVIRNPVEDTGESNVFTKRIESIAEKNNLIKESLKSNIDSFISKNDLINGLSVDMRGGKKFIKDLEVWLKGPIDRAPDKMAGADVEGNFTSEAPPVAYNENWGKLDGWGDFGNWQQDFTFYPERKVPNIGDVSIAIKNLLDANIDGEYILKNLTSAMRKKLGNKKLTTEEAKKYFIDNVVDSLLQSGNIENNVKYYNSLFFRAKDEQNSIFATSVNRKMIGAANLDIKDPIKQIKVSVADSINKKIIVDIGRDDLLRSIVSDIDSMPSNRNTKGLYDVLLNEVVTPIARNTDVNASARRIINEFDSYASNTNRPVVTPINLESFKKNEAFQKDIALISDTFIESLKSSVANSDLDKDARGIVSKSFNPDKPTAAANLDVPLLQRSVTDLRFDQIPSEANPIDQIDPIEPIDPTGGGNPDGTTTTRRLLSDAVDRLFSANFTPSAQRIADDSSHTQRAAALRLSVSQMMNGNDVNVESIFNGGDVRAAIMNEDRTGPRVMGPDDLGKLVDQQVNDASNKTQLESAEESLADVTRKFETSVEPSSVSKEFNQTLQALDQEISITRRIWDALRVAAQCDMGE